MEQIDQVLLLLAALIEGFPTEEDDHKQVCSVLH